MINFYDIAYGLGLGISAPYWFLKGSARRKVLAAFSQRVGRVDGRAGDAVAVMIHAVSLGEINATRALIELLRKRAAGMQFIVSVTTDTGFARAKELYFASRDVTLVRYPLDFSGAIKRMLDSLRPAVVVLMELEVWPNFIRRCGQRGIPVLLVNGRVTTSSFAKYKMAKMFVGGMFRALEQVCVQDETYRERFIELGARAELVRVTGTMKFDTAQIADHIAGQEELAAAVGLKTGEKILVCGSTGPGEEAIVLGEYRKLVEKFAGLRLVIVPRRPERFDDVAKVIVAAGFEVVRRSKPALAAGNPVILGDTIGDLRKFYALADVVFVGRTLVDLGAKQHGSDMMEPAALGKAVIVGPFTGNFAEAMEKFRCDNSVLVVTDGAALGEAIELLLAHPARGVAMGQRAREVVRREQGATERHAEVILKTLEELRK